MSYLLEMEAMKAMKAMNAKCSVIAFSSAPANPASFMQHVQSASNVQCQYPVNPSAIFALKSGLLPCIYSAKNSCSQNPMMSSAAAEFGSDTKFLM